MKGKINIVVAAGVGTLILMVAGASLLLWRGFSQFTSAGKKAETEFRKLEAFFDRNPFPSPANVEIAQTNATQLGGWYRKLSEELARGDIKVAERSPTMFMRRLQDTRNRLLLDAPKYGVALKTGFAFGFDRYLAGGEGSLPAPSVVSRLTLQLALVECICRVALEGRVASLDAIEREDLENLMPVESAPGPDEENTDGRRRGRSQPGAEPADVKPAVAFTKMRFAVDLTATESSLLNVLNALASDPVVMVVKTVSFHREGSDVLDVQRPTPPQNSATPPVAIPDRQERMISGPAVEKPARVRLEIDVYRFSGDEAGESN